MNKHLISTQSVGKSFGSRHLFSDITLTINDNDKLGLIGPNGSGKSTLLKILADRETADQGRVITGHRCHRVYLSQQDHFAHHSVEQVLASVAGENTVELNRMARETGFDNLQQPVADLSGGWLKRLAIAQALLQKPDLLLLDEPTNHLDLEGILWLEQVLKKASFAFILVSHDRLFLENTCRRTVELNTCYPNGFLQVNGPYSDFLEQHNDLLLNQQQQQQSLANKMRRELEWLRHGPKARTSKARYRIDQAKQLQQSLNDVKTRNNANQSSGIQFEGTGRKTKKLLETHNLGIQIADRWLLKNLDLILAPKTCLGILGQNGVGKSTLLKTLNGQLPPAQGYIKSADGVKIVTFDQKRQQLDPKQTLQQALAPHGDHVIYRDQSLHVAAWAKRFLFPPEQLRLPVAQLSGGEQARVLIANLMLKPADVLLLDEPTNDLDIATLEVLEDSLQDFPGAIVLISHDRYLLDRLCDRLLYLDGAGNGEFFADHNQWLAQRKPPSPAQKKTTAVQKTGSDSLTFEQRKELNRLEKRIEKAEQRVSELQKQLEDPALASDNNKLQEHYQTVQKAEQDVEALYERWEELESLR